jgi:hypothetical protein
VRLLEKTVRKAGTLQATGDAQSADAGSYDHHIEHREAGPLHRAR